MLNTVYFVTGLAIDHEWDYRGKSCVLIHLHVSSYVVLNWFLCLIKQTPSMLLVGDIFINDYGMLTSMLDVHCWWNLTSPFLKLSLDDFSGSSVPRDSLVAVALWVVRHFEARRTLDLRLHFNPYAWLCVSKEDWLARWMLGDNWLCASNSMCATSAYTATSARVQRNRRSDGRGVLTIYKVQCQQTPLRKIASNF